MSVLFAVMLLSSVFVFASAAAAESGSLGSWLSKLNNFLLKTGETSKAVAGYAVSEVTATGSCTDSDGGLAYSLKGVIIVNEGGISRTESDSCNSDGTLREWFCGTANEPAGLLRSENFVSCTGGYCKDGACVDKPVQSFCTDSDGGVDYYVKGVASASATSKSDYCMDDKSLSEYYCASPTDAEPQQVNYVCPVGIACKDGACVKQVACADSDGGFSVDVKGTASDASGSVSDGCVLENGKSWLNEWWCDSVAGTKTDGGGVYNCEAYGYSTCSDGACIKEEPAIIEVIGTTIRDTLKLKEAKRYSIKKSEDAVSTVYKASLDFVGSGGAAFTVNGQYTYVILLGNSKVLADGAEFKVHGVSSDKLSSEFSITVAPSVAPAVVKEQVKCVFANSASQQKCYSDNGKFSCSGVSGCTVDVSGTIGTKLTWKSSCGGYAYTVIDGNSKYVEFKCQPAVQSCTDSDGGKDYYVRGTSDDGKNTYNEYCSADILTERYCSGSQVMSEEYKCPDGCKDGACVTAVTPGDYCPSKIELITDKDAYRVGESGKVVIKTYNAKGELQGYDLITTASDFSQQSSQLSTKPDGVYESEGVVSKSVGSNQPGSYTLTVRQQWSCDDSGNKVFASKAITILPESGEEPPVVPEGNYVYDVKIKKGWNLVGILPIFALGGEVSGSSSSTTCSWLQGSLGAGSAAASYVKKNMFGYDPLSRRYISGEEFHLKDSPSAGDYLSNTPLNSFWLRSTEDCSITVDLTSAAESGNELLSKLLQRISDNNYKLVKGWNFFSVWPEMEGKTLDDIKGGCEIKKAYAYDPLGNKWADIKGTEFSHDAVGRGFVLKVADDCVPGQSSVVPPSLPEEESKKAVPAAAQAATAAAPLAKKTI